MSKRDKLGALVKAQLSQHWTLRQKDIGADAHLSKSGFTFLTEVYEVEGVGHLCVMEMRALLGLMKMETVVLACTEKDLPLLNLDWVSAFGKETQLVELYDTQLAPWPQAAQDAFAQIGAKDADLADYASGQARWYDAILYPCSYRKTGKGVSARLAAAASACWDAFDALLAAAPACDAEAKAAKVRAFAERLLAEGGPAVDQVTKLFGAETARRLVLGHMYGVAANHGTRGRDA